MRTLLILWLNFLISLGFAQSVSAEDAERRLQRIQVTALPPYMGTAYANAFTIRDADFERPGFDKIEIRFFPADFGDNGEVIPDTGDTQSYTISTKIPPRVEGLDFTDSVRDFYTQDIALRSGPYILSEISFRRDENSSQNDVSYCLSGGTLLFEILGRDTLFLGRMEIDYPPNTEDARRTHSPLKSMGVELSGMKGWRWTTRDLLNFDIRTVSFDPEKVCAEDSYRTSAWETTAVATAYSPSP